MTDDPSQRGGMGPKRARRTTWAFIVITIIMAGLTLGLPYLIHPSRPATPAHRSATLASSGAQVR